MPGSTPPDPASPPAAAEVPPLPPASAAPAAASTHAELVEEARLGGTDAGRAINAALLALSRTARAFQLYDAENEAVGEFVTDLHLKMDRVMALTGGFTLEVRPFELAWSNEVVYLERDRDRSLAFRFFRDGLRRLTVAANVPWEEVMSLLEVLSVRYAAVRQQEDDIVTLLRKADFKAIHIEAVEGFVPDEEVAEEGAGPKVELGIEAPADWDLPVPAPGAPAPLAWRDLPPASVLALAAEEAPEALAENAVRLVLEMLEVVQEPSEPTQIEDVLPFIYEARDFLLAEGALKPLKVMVEALARAAAGDLRPVASPVVSFGSDEAVRKLLGSLRLGDDEPLPQAALDYFAVVPGDRLGQAMDLLAAEKDEKIRARLVLLVRALADQRPHQVIKRMAQAEPRVARDLLGAVAAAAPASALEAALLLKDHPEPMVQLEVLQVLASVPYSTQVGRTVLHMLSSLDERVHLMAVEILATRGEQRAFDAMARHVEERASLVLSTREAEALGEALARLSPAAARPLFEGWLRPKGLLGKLMDTPAQRLLMWTAVSGLGMLPGEEPETALRALLEKTSGDLHKHIVATLVLRRRRAQAARPAGGERA